jgi:FlaA1/EpsC-like NDP-sugar epimerase
MTNFLGKIFKAISDLLSALVPYAVPIIPAYLTYFHTNVQMQFPKEIAWTAAFVVEVLGITAVSTAIRFYRHNLRYKDINRKAPFWLAIGVYIFYIVVVMTVNVVLEKVAGTRSGTVIFAIALFSLLSVPSGVLISIRTQFAEALEERRTSAHVGGGYAASTKQEQFKNEHREKITKTCANPNCRRPNREFITTFPNKLTCSDACRKALSRANAT